MYAHYVSYVKEGDLLERLAEDALKLLESIQEMSLELETFAEDCKEGNTFFALKNVKELERLSKYHPALFGVLRGNLEQILKSELTVDTPEEDSEKNSKNLPTEASAEPKKSDLASQQTLKGLLEAVQALKALSGDQSTNVGS
jgi:hypothetical protein